MKVITPLKGLLTVGTSQLDITRAHRSDERCKNGRRSERGVFPGEELGVVVDRRFPGEELDVAVVVVVVGAHAVFVDFSGLASDLAAGGFGETLSVAFAAVLGAIDRLA